MNYEYVSIKSKRVTLFSGYIDLFYYINSS